MKKLLYLIPLLLVVLNLTPGAIYKDTVGFSGKQTAIENLAPGNWSIISYNMGSSLASPLALNATASSLQTTSLSTAINPALSTNAQFKGFPFGAYFNTTTSTTTSYSKATEQVSAWSWLWSTADLLFIILALMIAYQCNKKAKKKTVNEQDSTLDLVSNNIATINSNAPSNEDLTITNNNSNNPFRNQTNL